jgi:hypothetical protein
MKYFEDFIAGETFTTPGRTITDADITDFAGVSGDFHSLFIPTRSSPNGTSSTSGSRTEFLRSR